MSTSGLSRWFRGLIGAICISSLVACGGGGGDDPPDGPPTTGSVSGLVVSASTGAPLAGATVTSGTASATTGADGRYTLNGVAPGAAVISFAATGHARNFANATVVVGATAAAGARLSPIGTSQTYAASAGATISMAGTPAQVTLPAAGIVDRNGAAFGGTVTVQLTPINPALDPGNMPGDMTTSVGGAVVPIESFGALTVTLQDGSGNRLNLGSGATATIRIPLATRSPNPPATIPLFYFNETTGLWVEEGTATLAGTAPNQYYQGTVSHFTVWNADQVANTVRVTGCVQESGGTRVALAHVRTDGLDYSGTSTAVTNADGSFSVAMRRGSRATVAAEFDSRYTNVLEVGPSETDITTANCLTLGNGTPIFVLHPVSQSVTEGGYVVLQAFARGQAPLRYQWQRNGVDVVGATSAVLLIDPVRNADNGAVYRVVASNGAGSTPSENATLTVASLPPAIGTQPAAVSVVTGQGATFTVTMLPQGAPLNYQWRRNGNDIQGAISASYTLDNAQLADSGALFSVRVSNAVGDVVSNTALLTVSAAPVAPSITTQPAAVSVNVGQSATFSVVATGSAPLTYQWRRNGVDIANARESSYTINATALSDNGAVFSVVVTNGVGNRTSGTATLTVTEPPVGAGYYHVAQSGAPVSGSIVFANGSQSFSAQAVVAVSSTNPAAGAVTIETAGNAVWIYAKGIETTISGGQASNTRERFSFYFKNSRLHRLDHVATSGAPVGQITTTLLPAELCGEGGRPFGTDGLDTLTDVADAGRTWLLLAGPGADGQCFTSDDVARAVRANMGPTDTALTLPGKALAEIIGSNGALQAVIVVEGQTLKRLDANLANPTTLMTLSGQPSFDANIFGSTLPGIWLFRDGDKLYAYKLDGSGGAPSAVVTLTEGEVAYQSWQFEARNGSAFVAISDATGARLLRIGSDLTVTGLGNVSGYVYGLQATPTRLLVLTQMALISQPLSGGAPTTLAEFTQMNAINQVEAAGETLYLSRYDYGQTGATQSVVVMQSDGSGAQTLDATAVFGTLMAPSVPLSAIMEDNVHAVILAQGVSSTGQYSGATLRAVLGSTGATLMNYGTMPVVSGMLMLIPQGLSPAHYGQTGLLTTMTFVNQQEAMGLLFVDTDAAGLTEITSPTATASASRMRPAQRNALPVGTMQRDGLAHLKVVRRTSTLAR
jgi:hypothetical protein